MTVDLDLPPLDELDVVGVDDHPVTESVKIFGPPGTGKTTNAAARVARLIQDHGYSINDVVWVTYRKALAMDTLKRLAYWGVIPESELNEPKRGSTKYIGTFHAVANRVYGGVGDVAGHSDKRDFCENRHLKYYNENPWETPAGKQLFGVFDYANKNLLDATDTADLRRVPTYDDLKDSYSGDVAGAYEDWERFKRQRDLIDFWEQLAYPLREKRVPDKPILVIDEFHDAYPLLARLAELWSEASEITIVAGDPHQVVNAYDGASPEHYHSMPQPEVLLPETYRVPREHWGPAELVLEQAHEPPDVERGSTGRFEVRDSPNFRHSQGEEWSVPSPEEQYSPGWCVDEYGVDAMFLTRTRHQLDGVAHALETAGVLYETPSTSNTPDWRPESSYGVNERLAIYNALQIIRGVSYDAFDYETRGLDHFQEDQGGVDPADVMVEGAEAAALIDHANSQYLSLSRADATARAKSWSDYDETVSLATLDDVVTREFWGTYTKGPGSVSQLNSTGKAGSTLDDRDFMALRNALQRNVGVVRGSLPTKVYTIHASKGNEAQNVFLYDGVTQRIQEDLHAGDAENEYRTWYVGMTRAAENLVVLKDGFEFTKPFLPRGRRLIEAAEREIERGGEAA